MNPLLQTYLELPAAAQIFVKAGVLMGVALTVDMAMRRAHPSLRVAMFRAAAVALIALPIASLLPTPFVLEAGKLPTATPAAEPYISPSRPDWIPPAVDESLPVPENVVSREFEEPAAVELTPAPFDLTSPMLISVYALGLLLAGLALLRERRDVRAILDDARLVRDEATLGTARELAEKLGLRSAHRIMEHDALSTPLVIGARKPTVLLPTGLAADELRAALAHELSHIYGNDVRWTLAFAVLRGGVWFHPGLWLMAARHRVAMEQAADFQAARLLGDQEDYARSLARVALRAALASASTPSLSGIAMARRAEVTDRIRRVRAWNGRSPAAILIRITAGGSLLLLLGAASARLVAEEKEAQPERMPIASLMEMDLPPAKLREMAPPQPVELAQEAEKVRQPRVDNEPIADAAAPSTESIPPAPPAPPAAAVPPADPIAPAAPAPAAPPVAPQPLSDLDPNPRDHEEAARERAENLQEALEDAARGRAEKAREAHEDEADGRARVKRLREKLDASEIQRSIRDAMRQAQGATTIQENAELQAKMEVLRQQAETLAKLAAEKQKLLASPDPLPGAAEGQEPTAAQSEEIQTKIAEIQRQTAAIQAEVDQKVKHLLSRQPLAGSEQWRVLVAPDLTEPEAEATAKAYGEQGFEEVEILPRAGRFAVFMGEFPTEESANEYRNELRNEKGMKVAGVERSEAATSLPRYKLRAPMKPTAPRKPMAPLKPPVMPKLDLDLNMNERDRAKAVREYEQEVREVVEATRQQAEQQAQQAEEQAQQAEQRAQASASASWSSEAVDSGFAKKFNWSGSSSDTKTLKGGGSKRDSFFSNKSAGPLGSVGRNQLAKEAKEAAKADNTCPSLSEEERVKTAGKAAEAALRDSYKQAQSSPDPFANSDEEGIEKMRAAVTESVKKRLAEKCEELEREKAETAASEELAAHPVADLIAKLRELPPEERKGAGANKYWRALRISAGKGNSEAADAVVKLAYDPAFNGCDLQVVRVLGNIQQPSVRASLNEYLLYGNSATVRAEAARALGEHLPEREAMKMLRDALASEWDGQVQQAIREALESGTTR